jgi:hypothetical protein
LVFTSTSALLLLSLSANRHDVGSSAEHGRFAFYFSYGCEQTLALRGIGPEAVEIAGEPGGPLDGD